MANGVKVSSYSLVHQALHGYSDGHQQLALSVKLKPRDQKTLLILSDISAPGSALDGQGYISGYPLTESGFFAIGRTWPALEMPRPGCVWTHTILIDFNDLATMDSLSSLLSLFKRPTELNSYESYSSPVKLAPAPHVELPDAAKDWTRSVIAALYARPKARIIAKREGHEIDEAVLSIWSQQWPRLRRNFRFCTLTATDRSMEGASFDLQVISDSKTNVRNRFLGVVEAESMQNETASWLNDAVIDLMRPDESGLRSFLRRVGPDVAAGREVFTSLCQLHRYLRDSPNNPIFVQRAVALLQTDPLLKQAKSAKAVTANAAMGKLETLDELSFDFLWENLDLVTQDYLRSLAPKLGQIVWQRDPQRLVPLLDGNSSERLVLEQALDTLELSPLIIGLRGATQLLKIALARRPELASEPLFWSYLEHDKEVFATVAEEGLQSTAIPALLEAGRKDSTDIAVQFFGGQAILEALSRAPETELSLMQAWVRAAIADVEAPARFLASGTEIARIVLHSLAQELHPDALPNQYGTDPWLSAWHNSIEPINKSDNVYMHAYFINRALGYNSGSQSELLQLSFGSIHEAAATNNLPEECWRLLESRLPTPIFWFGWDRCKRIREGIADVFVERSLSPACFAKLTCDHALFRQLIIYVAQSQKGRAYLERVRQNLIGEDSHALKVHHQIINEILYGYH